MIGAIESIAWFVLIVTGVTTIGALLQDAWNYLNYSTLYHRCWRPQLDTSPPERRNHPPTLNLEAWWVCLVVNVGIGIMAAAVLYFL